MSGDYIPCIWDYISQSNVIFFFMRFVKFLVVYKCSSTGTKPV